MTSIRDYLPTNDSGFLSWAQNFNSRIVAEGGVGGDAWGISAQQILDYTAAFDLYDAALTAATENSTRTPSAIQTKNDARDALKQLSRAYVAIVQINPAVTDTIRTDLQITIRDTVPTPIDAPTTAPILNVLETWGREITITLRDSLNSTSKAKPVGVNGANILTFVGQNAPTAAESWLPGGNATRTTHTVTFADSVPEGSKVWISAVWYNPKGETGPAATPVSAGIGYEGAAAAA